MMNADHNKSDAENPLIAGVSKKQTKDIKGDQSFVLSVGRDFLL